jgi:hypothetical protein
MAFFRFYDKSHSYLDLIKIILFSEIFYMKTRALIIIILFWVGFIANAQTVEPSAVVEKGNLQLEFEALFSNEKAGVQKYASLTLPKLLMRFGLSDRIELQLQTIFLKERYFENNILNSSTYGFSEMELGLALNLWEAKGILPETALMVRMGTSDNGLLKNIGNNISLNFSNAISNKLSVNYNIGTLTDLAKQTFGFYILNISYNHNPKWHFFMENSHHFTFYSTNVNILSTGFGLNVNDQITVDFSAGKNLLNNMFFTGMIFTWVVDTSKS